MYNVENERRFDMILEFTEQSEIGENSLQYSAGTIRWIGLHRPMAAGPPPVGLPDLQGFLKIPGQPVATVKIDYQAMPEVESAFLS